MGALRPGVRQARNFRTLPAVLLQGLFELLAQFFRRVLAYEKTDHLLNFYAGLRMVIALLRQEIVYSRQKKLARRRADRLMNDLLQLLGFP